MIPKVVIHPEPGIIHLLHRAFTPLLRDANIPAGIGMAQRIVEHIGIAVKALRIPGRLHKQIGAEETADQGVIHPAVHVYQPKLA